MSQKKPSLSLKFLEGVTEKLREENSDLKQEIDSLRGEVSTLQQELRTLSIIVSENIERREAVETGLVVVEQNCADLQENQKKISSAVELQAQYSRKTTLLLTGKVIPAFTQGEATRQIAVGLLKEYLGLDVHLRAITACHRLNSRTTILVRFADLDERMLVYRQRLSPKKRGLLIHESLTSERLAVIKILQKLHQPRQTSPFTSYYTSMGRIFIRMTDPAKAGSFKTLELPVGVTESEILDICGKQRAKHPSTRAAPLALGERRRQGDPGHADRGRGGAVRGGGAKPTNPSLAPPGVLGLHGAVAQRAPVPGAAALGAGTLGAGALGAGAPAAAAQAAAAPAAAAPAAVAPAAVAPTAAAPAAAALDAAASEVAAPDAAAGDAGPSGADALSAGPSGGVAPDPGVSGADASVPPPPGSAGLDAVVAGPGGRVPSPL